MSLRATANGARAAAKLHRLAGRIHGGDKYTAVATRRATMRRTGADEPPTGSAKERIRSYHDYRIGFYRRDFNLSQRSLLYKT